MADFVVRTATKALTDALSSLVGDDLIDAINYAREAIHRLSPFACEPVDCVMWVRADNLEANDYNPNSVAPPEMRLLAKSIEADGYTQPIVVYRVGDKEEIVDGFHRHRVGQEIPAVKARVGGYLPIVRIKAQRVDRRDRMAATIRHNRARGKHAVGSMSDIVTDLIRQGWGDQQIAVELGMDADEVLRLKQITGLKDLFAEHKYSEAWEPVV